ncbi:MAG: hydrogenobyrinic acid a,c-diamide synthase (glutamine-hydrolyzing) [Desulfobacteraceae bacterium]|nr:MAG: hydrogenobyrinic acid a,c-diamide synthase (glutamine-hydrolyzing) [Desulfobacteraceae bacterium]
MNCNYPRVVIAGLKGASGKTFLSLGILAAWKDNGLRVAPFKKGPDFIDAGWLSFAAQMDCRNLDPYLMPAEKMLDSFEEGAKGCDISVIEGNRGIFDGLDYQGKCSTSELARILKAPIVLVADVTMATRTVAALVKGCQVFEKDISIKGVILNRVGSSRQESLIRQAIESYCGIPTVGAVPKLKENDFPERHMGLIPHQEREGSIKALDAAKSAALRFLDLDSLVEIANTAGRLPTSTRIRCDSGNKARSVDISARPRIGVVRDEAFWFYYPENLEDLKRYGAEVLEISALSDPRLPPLDGLYIGGGFPETMADALSKNVSFRESLKAAVKEGLPVYAECGGLMYLGEEILAGGTSYPMAGIIPVSFSLEKRPQGHGYTLLEVECANPFYEVGEMIKGHEFHYSRPVFRDEVKADFAFKALRGGGIAGGRDGLCIYNILATYTHVHAGGTPFWAERIVRAALRPSREAKKMRCLKR